MQTHAALPTPVALGDGLFRIFFSTRDSDNRSSVAFVDVDIAAPTRIVGVAAAPVLTPGDDGAFDDSGVSLGSIVEDGGKSRLYYMGWNLGVRAPWRNSIGLAFGNAAAPSFTRASVGPMMDRSPEDPYTISYPWVLRRGASDWRMWYGSNLSWGASKHADMNHAIKYATSDDGLVWRREAAPIFAFADAAEYALARPAVHFDGQTYRMWYARRGERYRLGYAESSDGVRWTRRDEIAGLEPSPLGWDSDAICYPSVFEHAGRLYMAYNGNDYGRTGFGLAVYED